MSAKQIKYPEINITKDMSDFSQNITKIKRNQKALKNGLIYEANRWKPPYFRDINWPIDSKPPS